MVMTHDIMQTLPINNQSLAMASFCLPFSEPLVKFYYFQWISPGGGGSFATVTMDAGGSKVCSLDIFR